MYKNKFSLFLAFIFFLTACSLPAPKESPIPSTESTATETIPTATMQKESVSTSAPTQTPVATKIVQVIPAVKPTQQPALSADESDAEAIIRYSLQPGTPAGTVNFVHPEAGCNWMGIGGQVFSRSDEPVTGLIVEVGGTLSNDPMLFLAMTGGSTILGPGGYEITLADQPIASQGKLWVQLFDIDGKPQSEKVYFNTYAGNEGCEKNLVIINFRELNVGLLDYYFPSMYKNGR